jgi:hypothetical protein
MRHIRSLVVVAALLLAWPAPVHAAVPAARCSTPAAGTTHDMYAAGASCAVAKRVQRRYVRALGDCGNHVCAFVAAGRDWVCHDWAHDSYDQIRCVADTDHAVRVGWRDAEY